MPVTTRPRGSWLMFDVDGFFGRVLKRQTTRSVLLQLQPANDPHVVAVPQRSLPNGHAMGQRIGISQLNLLHNLTGLRIVLEKRVPIGVGDPEVPTLPTDSVRPIAGRVKSLLDDPRFWIQAKDHARRGHRHPKLAVPHLLAMSSGPQSAAAEQLPRLEAPHLAGVRVFSWLLLLSRLLLRREWAAARRRISHHLVDHSGSRREMFLQRLASHGVATHDFAAVGRTNP